uniref:Uncharacterized protein n=1 Tax=Timema bartmani TaxID=61472 RepID=A0A7R9EWD9_9NEOP|nr:unnamed protein product [Timema bartmani]
MDVMEEFPIQAYHPKVQVEYQVSPGCLPRRVQVERKRREYLAQDITKLLTELGVDPCTLIPPDDDNLDKYNLATSQHFLPLQIFDNQEFDCRVSNEWVLKECGLKGNPTGQCERSVLRWFGHVERMSVDRVTKQIYEGWRRNGRYKECGLLLTTMMEYLLHFRLEEEWLSLGEVQGVMFPVPAEAFIPVKSRSGESYGWATVAVQSYNKDTREYTVLPLDDSDTTRQLPRIYVMFKAEDPRNFAARIKDALDRRREAENLIRKRKVGTVLTVARMRVDPAVTACNLASGYNAQHLLNNGG